MLADDVWREVFILLEYQELLYCSRVCRQFRSLIQLDTRLQYIIELGTSGLVETAAARGTPTRILLDNLKRLRDRWRSQSLLIEFDSESINTTGWDHQYHGGLLLCYRELRPGFYENVLYDLASRDPYATAVRGAWNQSPDDSFDEYYIDRSANALFALNLFGEEEEHTSLLHMHVYDLSSGADHREAKSPTMDFDVSDACDDDEWISIFCQVRQDRVLVYIRSGCNAVLVIDWKSGVLCYKLVKRPVLVEPSWLLVSRNTLLEGDCMGKDEFTRVVNVYHLPDVEMNANGPATPQKVATFLFPTFRVDHRIPVYGNVTFTFLSADIGDRTSTRTNSTHCVPNEIQLLGLKFSYMTNDGIQRVRRNENIYFFTPVDTFVKGSPAFPGQPIPWNRWGPQSTRWYPVSGSRTGHFIHGWQVFLRDRILSFNQKSIKTSRRDEVSNIFTEPTNLVKDHPFTTRVTTSLPYRESRVRYPTFFNNQGVRFFMDEKVVIDMDDVFSTASLVPDVDPVR